MWYIRASAFTNTHHSSSNYLFKSLPGPTLTPSPGSPSRLRCCQPRDLSIPWILTAHSLLVFITLETFFILPFLKKLFTFSWGIIALQGCVGFCHTSTWISTYAPSWTSLPPPTHPIALGCHRAPDWAHCIIQQVPTGYLFNICNIYVSVLD